MDESWTLSPQPRESLGSTQLRELFGLSITVIHFPIWHAALQLKKCHPHTDNIFNVFSICAPLGGLLPGPGTGPGPVTVLQAEAGRVWVKVM